MLRASISLIILLLAATANAATVYVDNTASCTGDDGSDAHPWCTIQAAFDVVNAGDHIKIRTGSGTYSSAATLSRSGSEGNQIYIEPDTGADFIITNEITIQQSGYITVQNLIWDGAGVNNSDYGLSVRINQSTNPLPAVYGIQILNNTFKNWGGNASQASGSASRAALVFGAGLCGTDPNWVACGQITGAVVSGNTFDANRQASFMIAGSIDTVIENNEFKNPKFGHDVDHAVNNVGIKNLGGNDYVFTATGNIIRNNTFHDWVSYANNDVGHWYCDGGNCAIFLTNPGGNYKSGAYDTSAGFWCDVAAENSTVERNTVYNINPGDTDVNIHASTGINIEAGCKGWTVKNNVVYNIGYFGISGRNVDVDWKVQLQILHNTVYGIGGRAIGVNGPFRAENNIVMGNGSVALISPSTAPSGVGYTINNNLYYDSVYGQTQVGQWIAEQNGPESFTAWKGDCTCDGDSIYGNPLFNDAANGDFTLASNSPARNAGANVGVTNDRLGNSRPSGSDYDMGAYEYQEGGVRNRAVVISWR